MGNDKQRADLLSSWKEIANYLHCDVRTCIRWEDKYGLLVHRIEGAKGSRVFAYKTELDDWLKSRNSNIHKPGGKKKNFLLQKRQVLKFLFIFLPLATVALLFLIILKPAEKPSPPVLYDLNIVTAEIEGEGRLRTWGHTGGNIYENIWTTDSVSYSGAAIADVDGDGENEIVVPGRCEDRQTDPTGYPIPYTCLSVYKESGKPVLKNIWQTTQYSEKDHFVDAEINGTSNILFVDVDEDGEKEILLTNKYNLMIFKYDHEEDEFLLWSSRRGLPNLYMQFVSVAVIEGDESTPLRIFLAANEADKSEVLENKGWILICEMKDDYPLLIDSFPVDATFEPGTLSSGRVLNEETEDLLAIVKRKEGEFYYPFLLAWNREGEPVAEIPLQGVESPRSLPLPLDVGDLDGGGLDEIVIGTNDPDMLILFKGEKGILKEAERFTFAQEDIAINTMFIADTDGSPNTSNEIVVGGACLNVENRLSGFYLEIFSFTPDFHSKWQCKKTDIGERPIQYAAFGQKRSVKRP